TEPAKTSMKGRQPDHAAAEHPSTTTRRQHSKALRGADAGVKYYRGVPEGEERIALVTRTDRPTPTSRTRRHHEGAPNDRASGQSLRAARSSSSDPVAPPTTRPTR